MQNDKACGDHLVKMIMEKEASVYVCGDENAMGKDVQEAVTALLAAKLSTSSSESKAKENAAAYMNQMKATGHFVLDIWS
jgi:sulfite reductase alpha subunit-like flavoprotein